MSWTEEMQLSKARNELVVKDNRLLQTVTRRKYELKAQEQKIVGYLLSLIKPEDQHRKPPYLYSFDISTFCEVCGIETNNGKNIQNVKNAIEELSDRSFWLDYGEGEILFRWISSAEIKKGAAEIEVEISQKVFPFLVGLTKRFTQYELWQILPMKSTFSIALFEFLKSYAYKHTVIVSLDDLRKYFGISEEKYNDFRNFQAKVLNVAKKEINELTDLTIEWKGIRDGRKYAWIEFTIETKKNLELLETYRRSKAILNGVKHKPGQINMFE